MQPSDKADFLKVLNGMAAMKKAQLIPEVLDLWWACMADWSIEDFKGAAVHVMKNATFMPTPKDFEDLCKAGRHTAGEAFAKAVGWARSGSYRTPAKSEDGKFIDRVVHALGGYQVISMCDEEKLHFLEKRFAEHFETMRDSADVREALPSIAKPDWLQLGVESRRKALAKLESETES